MSLRKFALVSTLVILVSLPLFMPYAQLTSEFVDPIKNWSFEEGVQCPPWQTNNGGVRVRGVSGDVNGDGTVDKSDLSDLNEAYGYELGDPNWNPYCDLNGDSKVDALDLYSLSRNYGKTASILDDEHSWYTSGGGDYKIWQTLDSNTVNSIKGKTVTFAFWFSPESISSHENQDNSETHHYGPGYIMVSYVTIPSYGTDQRSHITNVHLDCKVEGGTGYYRITYRKEGEAADTVIVTDQSVTNTEYQTKSHNTDIWGDYGKTITIRFWTHHDGLGYDIWSRNYHTKYVVSPGENYARAEIFFLASAGPTYNWRYGDWVYPKEKKWHSVFVTAFIPSVALTVQVYIHGKPDFKAWIDLTSLSITETKSVTDLYFGDVDPEIKMSLAVNLFEVKDYGMPVLPCRAFLGVAMSAEIEYLEDPGAFYELSYTELEIKLIQGGSVTIRNVTQSNNADYVTDPDQTEEIENRWAIAGQVAMGMIVTTGICLIGLIPEVPTIASFFLDVVTGAGVSLLLGTYRSDADTPYTDELGGYVKARIAYGGSQASLTNERAIVELAFNPGSSCQVEVTGRVGFSGISKATGYPIIGRTLEQTISVTVSL